LPVTGKWAGKVKCFDVKVASAAGNPMTGILSMPVNAEPKSLPAIVFFHGAGVRSALQMHSYGRMAIALDVNTHGLENNRETAYYQRLFRSQFSNYWFKNKHDRNKYYFREIFLRAMRAVEYVKSLPEWNGKVLIVRGNSQGGAMAVVAAALDPQVTMLFAAVPALADHGGFTARIPRVPGWPGLYHPKRDGANVLECAKYYDIVNFAPMVKCPAYMSAGMADHTCEATSIAAAWNALPETSKGGIEYYPAGNHRTSQLSSGIIKKLFDHFKK
jgi:cephalosporin-C deacetylase-like acetyl esterase